MAWPASDAEGFSSIVTAPLSHFRLVIVALAPPTVNAAGFSTPLAPSAPTAAPMATRSKNASCTTSGVVVTCTFLPYRFLSYSVCPRLHISAPPQMALE